MSFDPYRSQRSRILLDDGKDLRMLLWIDRGRDGSFYFGPFEPDPGILQVGIFEATSTAPQQRARWDQIEPNFKPLLSPKLSLHPAQRGKAPQVHLRGFTTSGGKTKPEVFVDWDTLLEVPGRLGLLGIPERGALPILPSGEVRTQRDLVVPTRHFGAKPLGARVEAVPPGKAVNVSLDGDAFGAVALFQSSHGDIALVIEHKSAFTDHPPFFLLSLTSRGGAPYRSISIGFRRP